MQEKLIGPGLIARAKGHDFSRAAKGAAQEESDRSCLVLRLGPQRHTQGKGLAGELRYGTDKSVPFLSDRVGHEKFGLGWQRCPNQTRLRAP